MKRTLLIAAVATLTLAVFLVHLSYQPRGQARVIRNGDGVRLIAGRVGFAPLYRDRGCLVPGGEHLGFAHSMHARTAANDSIEMEIAFRYAPPPALRPGWPDGDWCRSL